VIAVFIFLLIIFLCAFAIQQLAKIALRKFFNTPAAPKNNNPYIQYHKAKMTNDDNYDEYLEWLKNKDVYGAPVEKIEDVQEKKAGTKVRRLFPNRKFTDDDKLF
jgi:predicted RND superfamily exporter protein